MFEPPLLRMPLPTEGKLGLLMVVREVNPGVSAVRILCDAICAVLPSTSQSNNLFSVF